MISMKVKVKILKIAHTLLSVHIYVFLCMNAEAYGLFSLQAVVVGWFWLWLANQLPFISHIFS
jgi:hypothetical protein